jgi:radical SAM superfamily enzyme YgiQ (UPF0313 family)
MTKKAGITVRCAFLLGCPGETTKNIDETIKYSIAIDPDIVIYNITTPFPGTEMFEWAKKNNYLATQNWDDYDLSEPIMTLPTIDGETLKKKYKQAFRAFYFRPKFIIKKLLTVNIFQINALLEGAKAFSSFMIRGLIGRKE